MLATTFQIAFQITQTPITPFEIEICGRTVFMRCTWCGEYFCFQHFYEEYQYCTNCNP
ncbi:hypothetical protein ALC57_03060 [Trachymyrmex cornetzi]|uniref:Transposase Tc5 C-terminal domain-containing protein n=1 Tax=Trachymyrmex cornetzi TaxID=471704 RepID=A0A151JMS3_9HYME|nr:hypothetical protein ALC57_03060 [Trachymyrmex cornetzi]